MHRPPRRSRPPTPALFAAAVAAALVAAAPAGAQDDPGGDAEAQRVTRLDLPPEAELAIDRALAWLAREQRADGSWGGQRYYVANTALATTAFLVRGHVPGKGEYGEVIDRGLDYLLDQAGLNEDGYITDPSSGVFYQHCLAVMTLAEAWGQSKDRRIGPAVRAGTRVILRSQGKEGGWRYAPKPTMGDISVTIMAIEALVSAKEAGVLVPDEALARSRQFLYDCQAEGGYFIYLPGHKKDETNSYRMGAGLLGLQLTGDRDSEPLRLGFEYLFGTAVEAGWAFDARTDWLDQFYCVQACYQAGDGQIAFWYPRIARQLVRQQNANGRIGGNDMLPHGSTAVATLILAVPYRYLPIFQR